MYHVHITSQPPTATTHDWNTNNSAVVHICKCPSAWSRSMHFIRSWHPVYLSMCSTPKCLHRFWVYSNRSLWKVLSRLVCILLDNKLVAGKIPRPKLSSSCRTNNPRIVARTALKGGGLRSSRGQQSMPAQIQKVCAQITCTFIAFKERSSPVVDRSLGEIVPRLMTRFSSKQGYKLFDDSLPVRMYPRFLKIYVSGFMYYLNSTWAEKYERSHCSCEQHGFQDEQVWLA